MRAALVSIVLVAPVVVSSIAPGALRAQLDEAPPGLARLELERSRNCVATLAEITTMNAALEPILVRGQRLRALSDAIALEDRSVAEPFDEARPADVRVREWFRSDAALAQRYVANRDSNVLAERTAGRETIKAFIAQTITTAQNEANAILETNQDLIARAGPCDGAVFVRSAVLEACQAGGGTICEQAALPAGEARDFRFVDTPESVWDLRELRPWTSPAPIRAGASGQLDGGRTIGYARVGNSVVSVAFTPLLRNKADLTPEQLARFQAVNDSLGLRFEHPVLAFTPAFGLRVALPQPLAEETRYVVHFDDPMAPDVVWAGAAGLGRPIEATQPLRTQHVGRFQAGHTLSLTAMAGPDGNVPAYTITLSNVNQAQAARVLLNYMTSQLGTDLNAIIQPRGQE